MNGVKMPKTILDTVFYSLYEISEETGLSKQTLRTYIKQDKLKAQKLGRGFYVTEENFRSFLKA